MNVVTPDYSLGGCPTSGTSFGVSFLDPEVSEEDPDDCTMRPVEVTDATPETRDCEFFHDTDSFNNRPYAMIC